MLAWHAILYSVGVAVPPSDHLYGTLRVYEAYVSLYTQTRLSVSRCTQITVQVGVTNELVAVTYAFV